VTQARKCSLKHIQHSPLESTQHRSIAMGSGASAEWSEKASKASDEELKAAVSEMSPEACEKLKKALSGASAGAESYPPTGLSPTLKDLAEWIKLGCGDADYYCEEKKATFPGKECPDKMPDLSGHGNLMAKCLNAKPEVYEKYKSVKTKGGVGFAQCIKTGIDNPGHPHILTCGLVAGDEECYETFKDMFDQVVADRNGGYAPDAKHPTDMDISKVSSTKIDPTGNYVLTTRCRTGRSIRGLALPPAVSFEDRRKTEKLIVEGLNTMEGDLKGKYLPLFGSKSMGDACPCMTEAEQETLRTNGNLFQEPDSTLLLSSGMGRHWPDARGIFCNEANNFFVWVNEEDQMRIVSMEKGDDVKKIFQRFVDATQAIEKVLSANGYEFMHNDHLGYILTCPSNLGTGLRAGSMVKLPLLSARPDFKDTLKKMKLQARGTAGVDSASTGGTWDISNSDRLGTSEVDLVNLFVEGVAQVIRWEQALEAGTNIDEELANAKPLGEGA